jgi:hypothetical protein
MTSSPECSGNLFFTKVPKMEFNNLCFDGGRNKSGQNETEIENFHRWMEVRANPQSQEKFCVEFLVSVYKKA